MLATGEAIAPLLAAEAERWTVEQAERQATGRRQTAERADDSAGGGVATQKQATGTNNEKSPTDSRRAKLAILESTTYPGTTDEDLRKVLENGSVLTAGQDFHLRELPANYYGQL